MTLQNNRAPLLCYFKLCASFRSHWWIQTGVTVRKRPIWVKFDDFLRRVTLKFDGWPRKTIGHLFMLLQALCIISYPFVNSNWSYSPETPNSGQIPMIFRAVRPWNLTDDLAKQQGTSSMLLQALCIISYPLVNSIWVTIRKRSIRVKIDDFLSRVTKKFYGWLSKTIGLLFYATSSFVHHFVPIGEFKLELQSGNAQFGSNSDDF